jgi:hypothetical protein
MAGPLPLKSFGPTQIASLMARGFVPPITAPADPRVRVFSFALTNAVEQWKSIEFSPGADVNGNIIIPSIKAKELALKKDQELERTGHCFLCGLPYGKIYRSDLTGLGIASEHLLPSAEIFLLTGFPIPGQTIGPKLAEVLSKNFLWAHSYCNGLKSAKQFITVFYGVGGLPDSGIFPYWDPRLRRPVTINDRVVDEYAETLATKVFTQANASAANLYALGQASFGPNFTVANLKDSCKRRITESFDPLITVLNRPDVIDKLSANYLLQIGLSLENLNQPGKAQEFMDYFNSTSEQYLKDQVEAEAAESLVSLGRGRTHKKRNRKSKTYKRKNGRNPRTSQALAKYHPK